ncbi:glutamate racemase [Buchnera aphidicola]|uniref:Glutamate racemase n=1 Tax=Buchnera aphidicola (Aphis gossypii) TaxID=98785 RepID=A0A5J6ZCG2_9GAMM|nr:glutamate racemase [Buchnera aphidicola]QFQ32358.1 glutamate racemase [Buchnera aphidicola (Aphis gossypii)]UPT14880.1 glutamate racemase [Buchnera aphidicola (Aphis gossypii)]
MLIFDSGIGGISILKNIKKKLPNKNYIYLLDNKEFPYGEKKESFIIKRSIKIINKIINLYPIQIVVIACNTVSTISLHILKKKFNIPIVGVLPSLDQAMKITQNKKVGIIATKATIKSSYVKNIISKYTNHMNIEVIATNELARIAEKKIRKISFSNFELKKIFYPWMILAVQPDTIYLGCTHFSFLKNEIQNIFYKPINFLDSYTNTTKIVKKYFLNIKNSQNIKKNVFLYSKYNKNLDKLLYILKKYKFNDFKKINLN